MDTGSTVRTHMRVPSEGTQSDAGAKPTNSTQVQLYGDDLRISKILRRLQMEHNPDTAKGLCKKLETAVRSQQNVSYICRSFDFLLDNLVALLKQSRTECSEHLAVVLGLVGYINRADFPIFKNCITKSYHSSKNIQKYLMLALKTTFSCDVNLELNTYSDRIIVLLQDYLENAELAEHFIAVSEAIAAFSKNYSRAFEDNFRDIVDIIVGWHLEVEQPHTVKLHCSRVLQQFSGYFLNELNFTLGLLSQFMEDIEGLEDDAARKDNSEERIGTFIGAFTSILKALATRNDFVGLSVGHTMLNNAVEQIFKSAKQCLRADRASEETVLNVNDFLCLLITYKYNKMNYAVVEEIIELQLKLLEGFSEPQTASLLYLILCYMRELKTALPHTLVTLIFRIEHNPLASIKLHKKANLKKLLLKIYQEVLMIKNVRLLQEVYKHITLDIDRCMNTLEEKPESRPKYEIAQAEMILTFYLSALSVLATQTSSIIGMYALRPSILELLITQCKAAAMDFWKRHETLHYALLNLLVAHCQKNHNFRPTSTLLMETPYAKHSDDTNSPTSENFNAILKFLSEILSSTQIISVESLKLLQNWLKLLLTECKSSASILQNNPYFVCICKSIAISARKLPLECAPCVEVLLTYTPLNEEALEYIRDMTMEHIMNADDPQVKSVYAAHLGRIPLWVIFKPTKSNEILDRRHKIAELNQWYHSSPQFAPLRNRFFATFLEMIKISDDMPLLADHEITDIFVKCWTAQFRGQLAEFQQMAIKSPNITSVWLQYEVARYCVQNKLRTTVGKPQDTFLAIEAIIMRYARIIAAKDDFACRPPALLANQKRIRMLLAFLENLEKVIYNAAEGTAFAIPPAEKPAKSFFRINEHTCKEWFKRIRPGVNLIALHSMEDEMVIRYSEEVIKNGKLGDASLDHTVTALVAALLRRDESDALQGLHIFLKANAGKRYVWIQHASEQAAGHKELAAKGYLNYLQENEAKLDANTKEFLVNQLLDCQYYTGQWLQSSEYLKEVTGVKPVSVYNMRPHAHLQVIDYLYNGGGQTSQPSKEVAEALLSLTEWPADHECKANLSFCNTYQTLEDACLKLVMATKQQAVPHELQQLVQMSIQEGVQHGELTVENRQLSDFLILHHAYQKLIDGDRIEDNSFDCSQTVSSSTILTKCLVWNLLCEQRLQAPNAPRNHSSLYLDIAACARREGNYNYGNASLQRFFSLHGFEEPQAEILEKISADSLIVDIGDKDLLRGYGEMAKCLYEQSASQQLDAINIGSGFCYQVKQQLSQDAGLEYPEACASMLLTMADWISQRGNTANNSPQLQRLLDTLPDIPVHYADEKIDALIQDSEKAVGKLLSECIIQRSDSGEAWYAFGNWCYRWGKKIVEANQANALKQRGNISQHDLLAIRSIVGDVNEADLKHLVDTLNSHELNTNDSVEDIETNEFNSSEILEMELKKLVLFANKPAHHVDSVINIWRHSHRSIYAYYELATKAYFKYLSIATEDVEPQQNACQVGDSTFVTTTLRLLRLIVKHAIGLQETLEEGFRSTPLRPWKVIIPQLFSRLNHHEPYVRESVADLLCRLAEDRPHLVIFPAVVGAQQELKRIASPTHLQRTPSSLELDELFNDITLAQREPKHTNLSTCFSSLVSTLSGLAPQAVLHVQLLVKELKRIALLWEEYWMHSLAQLYGEYSPLFVALESEFKKATEMQMDIIKKKHAILIRHAVVDLKKIAFVTDKPAETNYEHNFQQRFQEIINNAIATLEQPASLGRPIESWQKIKELYTGFQQRSLRNSPSTLKISDLSPVLAAMEDTPIAMPGVDTFEKHPIHIKSVDSTVYILPTKTKPKKLAFFGSNGVKYTYLFKGLEDLHLDERIMQFLSISNSMMARSGETPTSTSNAFKAHHYSVIPLGPQSGLISWVDGVTPLFSIYKKWQQRDIAIKQQQKERPTNKQTSDQIVVPPTRPSELFYNKLTPLLTAHNLKVSDPRKLWPIEALRRVLTELSEETPKDLLAMELWCHAINAAQWRKSVRNYSISVAVMSVIGYVIGLGDRHLDNVLIRLNTGEIVHIDYNVCFEKGKTLRVPEKVPFRMTPNLREALGITGVEGVFRLSCEHVLKTLRKERETLLTLLEAFVYDPLVDWTLSDDGSSTAIRMTSAHLAVQCINNANFPVIGSSRESTKVFKQESGAQKKPDWKSTRQLIEKRFNDIKPQWQRFRNDVHSHLNNIAIVISQLQNNREVVRQTEQERDILTKQTAMIRELNALGLAMGSHALNTITQRYKVFKQDTAAFVKIKDVVKNYNTDINVLIRAYFERIIIEPPKHKLTFLQRQLNEQRQGVYANEFVLIRELFHQQGHQQIADEGEFLREELENSIGEASLCAGDCQKMFMEYVSIMQLYPHSRLKRSRLMLYEEWSRQMLDDQCDPKAIKRTIRNQMQENVGENERKRSQALDYAVALGKIYTELNLEVFNSIAHPIGQYEQQEFSMDEITHGISGTLADNPAQYAIAMQLNMLPPIEKANDEFRAYEEAAFENDAEYILEHQLLHIDMVLTMWRAAFTGQPRPAVYEPMQALRATLFSLETLQDLLDVPSVENVVHLFMLDDNEDIRSALDIVCDCPTFYNDLQRIEALSPLISSYLEEVFARFNEFKQNLKSMGELSTNGFAHKKKYLLKPGIFEETVSKIFSAVRENAASLIGSSKEKIYDIRSVRAPLIAYIRYVEKNFLKGLTPNIVHTFRLKCVNNVPWEAEIPPIVRTNAQTLCENVYGMLKHNLALKSQKFQVLELAKLLKHHIWVLSAHYWAHEYLLKNESVHATNEHLILREQLLDVVAAHDERLRTWRQTSAKVKDALEVHSVAASEHLKRIAEADQHWENLESTFLEITNMQRLRYSFYTKLSLQLNEYVDVLLKSEELMNDATLMDIDQTFMSMLEQYEAARAKWLHSHSLITPVEQGIVQLLDPEGNVDRCWIENISGLLDEMTYAVQRKLVTLEQEEQLNKECIFGVAQHLQTLIDSCVRTDMRQLLKLLLKNDKLTRYASTDPSVLTRIREFQQVVRGFYNELSELHLLLLAKELTPAVCEQIQGKVSELLQLCTDDHDELLQVIQNCIQQSGDASTRPLLTLTDSQSNNNKDSPTGERKAINPEQKRNAYAVSVWKRIRIKLEGRDPDPNRRTVAEQVDFIINEAMNPDNLAVLYEGWTPWV